MIKLITFACVSMATIVASTSDESELEYVFEIVRHGARAPIMDDSARFKVAAT